MGLYYTIGRKCEVKKRINTDDMIRVLENEQTASLAYNYHLREGLAHDDAMLQTVSVEACMKGHVCQKEISLREVHDQYHQLEERYHDCINCLIGKGDLFGCCKKISFPVSAKAETWLMDLARESARKGNSAALLVDYIEQHKVSGDIIARERKQHPGMRYELHRPIEAHVRRGLLRRTDFNSDQLLELLFATPELVRKHMLMILHFTGGLKHQEPKKLPGQEVFKASCQDMEDKECTYFYCLPDYPEDDNCIRQLKVFFRDVFRAVASGYDIYLKDKIS